ncbi:ABC transporter ATP-binding protein [Sphaerotilus sp.]|jgi:branched-chain amino acid transport system ATP-binding protein|uniref:ABC transporter ATP-binding protein n=1 Tax=Sphaerotilus sp. TaxID=2093942 RepID=UPI0025E2D8EE|nr:ATP-binding cassette domain-containing protein [Sphaerotilus sp.]
MMHIDNLVMVRGTKPVVHGIQLRLAPGAITALMGPNGAGKTSTVLGIAGVIEPAFGQIKLDGLDLKGLAPDAIRRHGVATVPEGHQVLRELTVRDNLRVAGSGLGRGELDAALQRTLDLFPELKDKLAQPAGDLSGGQQQMVALAQALVVTPRFLVIDELSFGLAPTVVARLVPVVRRIAAQGIGVLLIEQFTQLALGLSDHVYVLSRGRVSYDGTPDRLRADPDILHRAYFPVSDREAVGLT